MPNRFCTDARLQFIMFMLIFILLTWIISSFALCTKWKEEIIRRDEVLSIVKHLIYWSIQTQAFSHGYWTYKALLLIFTVSVTYSCRDLGQTTHSYSRGREVIRYIIYQPFNFWLLNVANCSFCIPAKCDLTSRATALQSHTIEYIYRTV